MAFISVSVFFMDENSIKEGMNRLSSRVDRSLAQRRKLQVAEARYTLVLHHARKNMQLTINEYCLADAVHKLSSTRSPVPGWCYASKEHLARSLGFSRQSIHSMLKKLKEKGIVESQPETNYLRATALWYETVEVIKNEHFGSK